MNKFAYKLASGIAAASLFALTVAPSAFAWTGNMYGNGAYSNNRERFNNFRPVTVRQNNNTNISNNVNTYQNTGNNVVVGNTGGFYRPMKYDGFYGGYDGFDRGNVSINTGSANAYTNINNNAGYNYASVNGSGYW